jgi:hypothetical protein
MITRVAGTAGDQGRKPVAPLADPPLPDCFKAILIDRYVTYTVTIKGAAGDWAASGSKRLPG